MAVDAAIVRLEAADAALSAGRPEEARRLAGEAALPLRGAGFHREIDRLLG
jgi:hypothetical protein